MNRMLACCALLVAVLSFVSAGCNAQPVAVESLNLVPWPASVQPGRGAMPLGAKS